MKKYLLFQYNEYEPSGGWYDLHGDFENIEDAKAAIVKDGWHIVDIELQEIVFDSSK
jgi:hypothetical protein